MRSDGAGHGSRKFEASSHVVSRLVGDETVLVDLDIEQYYSLNHTGSLIWDALRSGESVEEVISKTVAMFGIDQGQAEAEVEELVEDLVGAGLLLRV